MSPAAAQKAAKTYADSKLELMQVEAEINQAIAEIKGKHAKNIEKLQTRMEESQAALQSYAEGNREELFVDTKTLQLGAVKLIFKTNPPKLAFRKGWNEDKALPKVKELLPDYIKIKETIDKAGLKKVDDPKVLKSCGLEIIQEEVFKVELAS